jgi:hypothetical protein
MEQKLRRGEQHVLAAAFRMAIDGVALPAFVAGGIGADATIEGARAQTAGMWFAQYGSPIGHAIATWLGAEGVSNVHKGGAKGFPPVDVDGQALYHGSIAIHSDAGYGEAASEEFLRNVARRALPLLGERSRFRSATIKVFVQEASVKDGECLVNGSASAALLNELREMNWPEGDAAFLYTVFFAAPPAR